MLNITIDIRKNLAPISKITKNILSRSNKKSIFVPGGCANLFLTLENNTIIHYYMNALYKSKEIEVSVTTTQALKLNSQSSQK